MYYYSRYFLFVFSLGFSLIVLSSCTESQYVAHVAKQIPFPGDTPKTVGYFKVGNSYTISNKRYYPAETYNHTETGVASWYGPNFHGKMTANGEIFNKHDLTAAHRTLQMPSIIRVTNLANGRSLYLRVNDRGPFSKNRVLDVSERAASLLGFKKYGTTRVKIEVMPEASRQVASLAKSGRDTTGFEVALNTHKTPTYQYASYQQKHPEISTEYEQYQSPKRVASVVEREPIKPPMKPVSAEPITYSQAPSPASKPYVSQQKATGMMDAPIPPQISGNIFVQAGAFSQEQNALNYSTQMAQFAPSKVYRTMVNNQPYYRVRLGPFEDRNQASIILSELRQGGNNNAVIVVD